MKISALFSKVAIRILPKFFKRYVTRMVLHYVDLEAPKKYACSVCGKKVTDFKLLYDVHLEGFQKHGYIYPLYYWETFNYLQYRCPHCDSSDRDRLYALYFREQFSRLDPGKKYRFLDFAPMPGLSKFILSFSAIDYRSADLMMEHVDDHVDITDLSIYEDNRFDFLLCSHVLEHVQNDRQAIRELYRVLKPGGWGIIMVPILLKLEKSHEDYSLVSAEDRWKYYGQHDHVRMYAKADFIGRLSEAGFNVQLYDVKHFSEQAFDLHGISPGSVLYVARK